MTTHHILSCELTNQPCEASSICEFCRVAHNYEADRNKEREGYYKKIGY